MIDDTIVGSFSISAGETQVIKTFNFPTVAAGSHTFRIETARTVNSGCGSAGLPNDVSVLLYQYSTSFFIFPATGDTRFTHSGSNFWNAGDYVEGTRTAVSSFNRIDMVLMVENNSLSCDTQDHYLMIDDTIVGSFSINAGETQVIQTFNFPAVAAGSHTFRIETARTVNSGCGSAGLPNDVSVLLYQNSTSFYIFPATGDTRFTHSSSSFWNAGDYVEGTRTAVSPFNRIDMILMIDNNVLSCDTQDHYLMIDDTIVGSFSISAGETQVIKTFNFPAVAAGSHTFRIETARTVNGGCGSAGLPNDVSVVYYYQPVDVNILPAVFLLLLDQ
jgi:hypothetical protein